MDTIMTDEELEQALDALAEYADNDVKRSLAQLMNEHQIITWEEAEQILADTGDEPVKCSLPQQTRPTEPENDTNPDASIQRLLKNDPNLSTLNLNNMKRIPIPQLKRVISAMKENEHVEKLSLANMGLYDNDLDPLIEILEENESIRSLNLETNYLSGEFFAKLFEAALKNQTLEEVKAVNQGVSFSTTSERAIIKAIFQNRGLLKVSFNFRLPEGRHKVEQATMRNQEIRRILRRQAAEEERLEAERRRVPEKPKPEPKIEQKSLPKKEPVIIKTSPSMLKTAGAKELPKPAPVDQPKPESSIPKWRRPKEEAKPETSEENKPVPTAEEPKKKNLVTKSSSNEAVDGVEDTKIKKKKASGLAPMILAEPVPDSNGVAPEPKAAEVKEKTKPKLQRTLTATPSQYTSDSESMNRLSVPHDQFQTSTTSATSESDAPNASPKPKKKIVRRKKRVVTNGESKLNGTKSDDPKLLPTPNGNVPKTEEPASSNTENVEKPAAKPVEDSQAKLNNNVKSDVDDNRTVKTDSKRTMPVEDGELNSEMKPKKKIIRVKKKKVVTNGEPNLNGAEPDSAKSAPKVEEEPRKVFSRTKLYGANK